MKIQEAILYALSKRWKSPVKKQRKNFGEDVTSVEYHLNYALYLKYLQKVRSGLNFNFIVKFMKLIDGTKNAFCSNGYHVSSNGDRVVCDYLFDMILRIDG